MFNFWRFFQNKTSTPLLCTPILKDLMLKKAPLMVSFPPDTEHFMSLILKVSEKPETIILDELNPSHGHKKMAEHIPFLATANLYGVKIAFQSQAFFVDTSQSVSTYHIDFPYYFNYQERRTTERFITKLSPIKALLRTQAGQVLPAEVVDISTKGIQAHLRQNVTFLFSAEERLDDCVIYLDGGDIVDTDFYVRHIHYEEGECRTTMGLTFARMTDVDERMIKYFIEQRTEQHAKT